MVTAGGNSQLATGPELSIKARAKLCPTLKREWDEIFAS
jgi:hypothetical protein